MKGHVKGSRMCACLECLEYTHSQARDREGEKRLALDQRTELVCLSYSFGLLSESSCNLSCSKRKGSVSSVRAGVAPCVAFELLGTDGG